MKRIKNFTRYLVDNGLLFEINRKVLNPYGLFLDVDMDPNNRSKLVISKLYDAESEEGFTYDEDAFKTNLEILNNFLNREGNSKLQKREEVLGFVIQEKPKEPDE